MKISLLLIVLVLLGNCASQTSLKFDPKDIIIPPPKPKINE